MVNIYKKSPTVEDKPHKPNIAYYLQNVLTHKSPSNIGQCHAVNNKYYMIRDCYIFTFDAAMAIII